MERNGRDNIVIGLMVILTYFLIYTFMAGSSILESLGGLPLINCTTDLIQNGFSLETLSALTKDFGQTIIIIYIVVFVQNLIPTNGTRRPGAIIGTIIGYIVLYLISMWVVRYIVFSDKMNEIVKMFISIFSVVIGGFGALFSSPIRRVVAERFASEALRNYLMNSRIIQWLANSFFISASILFIAVAIEMTVGLPFFFAVVLAGFPAIITLILMIVGLYCIVRVR